MRQTDKIEWTPQPKCAESDRPNEPNNKKLTTNQTIEIHGQFTPFPIRSDCRQFSVMLHKYTRANNNNEKMFGDFFFRRGTINRDDASEWQSKESEIDCPKLKNTVIIYCLASICVLMIVSCRLNEARPTDTSFNFCERYFRYANWSVIIWVGWQFRVKHFSHQIR